MSGKKRNILVIDIGGTNVKIRDEHRDEPVKIPSGEAMSAAAMIAAVLEATEGWNFTHVSIGYPGPVVDGRPAREPANLDTGWMKADFADAFGKPVKLVNDAAMQALGSYHGGRMLFLGLGTGLGSALILDGALAPLELAHLPYKNGKTYEDYLGKDGLARLGKKTWRKHVERVAKLLRDGLVANYVVLGGGNAELMKDLPEGMELGSNANAFEGGFRLWK
jgi:polyphosphate glucokinase